MLNYEQLLVDVDAEGYEYPDLNEYEAAAMCYTSGTTGRPKGVLYSHRAIVLHSLASTMADGLGMSERDVVCPVVPMFHVNAWGLPFTATMVGAKQVMPGPYLDPPSLLELFASERVTVTAGVPTIWLGILYTLDKDPQAYDLSAMRGMIVGGQAAPRSMIEEFEQRHGLNVVHAWGMTETTPLGTISMLSSEMQDASEEEQYAVRSTQGKPVAFVEIRARGENGIVPWDGKTMGELEVRGPWVAADYYGQDDRSCFTDDGWFRTGDIVTIDPRGYVTITDREKDVIKSGGEWISSVALENALMAHPSVAEAAVFAVPHAKWIECPMGVVVLREGATVDIDDLKERLAEKFVRYWVPDRIDIVEEIPKTATGKFRKIALREQYRDVYTPKDESVPAS
jgi:fatty-acyl-CoA synthase